MLNRPNLSPADNRRIQAMLRANNNGGNLRQQLLDGAPFLSELLHTAIPQRAASGTTATFTRATAKRWKNNDGYEVVGLAGEIDFPGARRVYNQVSIKSADNTVGSAVSANVTVAATTIAFNSANASYWYKGSVGNSIVGHTYMVRAMASCTVDRTVCFRALELSGGGVVSNVALTSTPQEISLVFTASVVGTIIWGVENRVAYASDTGTSGVITFTDLQIADVTAETDQTTPREYVSVGVASSPYYHGSMVDGVKCFPTDINGVPLTTMERYKPEPAATNTCLQSNAFTTAPWVALSTPTTTQNAVGPNGQANYAWTLEDNDGSNYEGYQQALIAWAAGASGCYSILVEKKASSPSYPCLLMYYNRASNLYHYIIVNEVAGTVAIGGSTNPPAYGCVSFNDDFWLVWVAGTQAGATVSATVDIYPAASVDGTTLSATKQGSTVFCDAQFESGATYPSSRINTTTIAVARNSDVFAYSGGNVPYFKMLLAGFNREAGRTNYSTLATLSDGTSSNYAGIFLGTGNQLQFAGGVTGVAQWDVSSVYTPDTEALACQSWATNDVKMGFNGATITPDTVASVPTVTQLQVGYYTAALYHAAANIGPIVAWTRNGSQTEVNAVSTP